jgi:phosphate transport system substrate-binding protein
MSRALRTLLVAVLLSAMLLSATPGIALLSPPRPAPERIVVDGAESMILLAQQLAKLFAHDSAAAVEVRAGGVPSALAGLHSGKTDIAQSIRALSPAELAALRTAGGAQPIQIKVAVEGVVVVVHPSNPLTQLTMRQLKDIYLGKITNWKELGGKDARIQLYSTESAVGGSLFFNEAVLEGAEFDTAMRGFANAKNMAEAVAADPNGIGFGNPSALGNTKPVRIAAHAGSLAVEATSDNLRVARYPVSRYLFWIVSGNASPATRNFATWVLSHDGQLVVESRGYYPLTPAARAEAAAKLAGANGHPSGQ